MPAPFWDWWLWQCHGLLSYGDGICCVQLTLGHHPQGSNLITSVPKSRKAQISIATLLLFIWVRGGCPGRNMVGWQEAEFSTDSQQGPKDFGPVPTKNWVLPTSWMGLELSERQAGWGLYVNTVKPWARCLVKLNSHLHRWCNEGGFKLLQVCIYLFIIFLSNRKMNAAHL